MFFSLFLYEFKIIFAYSFLTLPKSFSRDTIKFLFPSIFFSIFILILLPSALWMPLTNLYVGAPSTGTWVMIRIILALVGIGSIALVWALLTLQSREGVAYWLAVAGGGYFAFHTAILDAILWAHLFK